MVVGPFPTLDGISDVDYKRPREDDVPQITVFPAVNEEQLRKFKQAFINAGPLANGYVTGMLPEIIASLFKKKSFRNAGDKVLDVYMSSNLSYEIIRAIMFVDSFDVLSDPFTTPFMTETLWLERRKLP